jgi:hypothetical protein
LPHIGFGVFDLLKAWMIFIATRSNEIVTTIIGIVHENFLSWQRFGTNFGVHGAKIMKMKWWNNSCVG